MTESVNVALYGHWICPYSIRVEFALHQRGVTHELIEVPPLAVRGADAAVPEEFVEHSPRLEIPMVRVGEEYRADSIPVLRWLEDVLPHPPLLPDDAGAAEVVGERMAWIDANVFRPTVGVYYGTTPEKIERAGVALAAALAEVGDLASETGWLAGPAPTLAEAVVLPVYVRLDGLRRLGFTEDLSPAAEAHADRCRSLAGWAAVAWSTDQTDEFVGRFEAYRRKQTA